MKKILLLIFLAYNLTFSQKFDYKNYSSLLNKYVSEKGNVKYDKLNQNKEELNAVIAQFEKTKVSENWSKNEKMAYYINTYNIFTLKSIIDNYPVKSIKDIDKVWDKKIITTSKEKLSLSEVENKILRKMGDPRIHFAINCASFSCPNLLNTAYLPEILDKQLEKAAKSFINDSSKNTLSDKELNLSEIFNWFAEDFKKKGTLIDFLNKYATSKIDSKAVIKFKKYDWSLNK